MHALEHAVGIRTPMQRESPTRMVTSSRLVLRAGGRDETILRRNRFKSDPRPEDMVGEVKAEGPPSPSAAAKSVA